MLIEFDEFGGVSGRPCSLAEMARRELKTAQLGLATRCVETFTSTRWPYQLSIS